MSVEIDYLTIKISRIKSEFRFLSTYVSIRASTSYTPNILKNLWSFRTLHSLTHHLLLLFINRIDVPRHRLHRTGSTRSIVGLQQL